MVFWNRAPHKVSGEFLSLGVFAALHNVCTQYAINYIEHSSLCNKKENEVEKKIDQLSKDIIPEILDETTNSENKFLCNIAKVTTKSVIGLIFVIVVRDIYYGWDENQQSILETATARIPKVLPSTLAGDHNREGYQELEL